MSPLAASFVLWAVFFLTLAYLKLAPPDSMVVLMALGTCLPMIVLPAVCVTALAADFPSDDLVNVAEAFGLNAGKGK